MKHVAAVSLGSNIDPETNMAAALEALESDSDLEVVAVSSYHDTEAVGRRGQPPFVNAAAVLETELAPEALRIKLRKIEAGLGRVRTEDRYAARPIDLDILLFDDLTATFDGWQIPDPDVLDQPHILMPLAEIAPNWRHPIAGSTVASLLAVYQESVSRPKP